MTLFKESKHRRHVVTIPVDCYIETFEDLKEIMEAGIQPNNVTIRMIYTDGGKLIKVLWDTTPVVKVGYSYTTSSGRIHSTLHKDQIDRVLKYNFDVPLKEVGKDVLEGRVPPHLDRNRDTRRRDSENHTEYLEATVYSATDAIVNLCFQSRRGQSNHNQPLEDLNYDFKLYIDSIKETAQGAKEATAMLEAFSYLFCNKNGSLKSVANIEDFGPRLKKFRSILEFRLQYYSGMIDHEVDELRDYIKKTLYPNPEGPY